MNPLLNVLNMDPCPSVSRPYALRDSPIRKLPNELVVKIFLLSTFTDYPAGIASLDVFATQLPTLSRHRAPLKLCHICYPLRWLALNCPLLWARFELRTNPSSSKAQSDALLWTTLSRSHPITFSLHLLKSWDSGQGRIQMESYTVILAVLLQHVNRWKNVHLVVPTEDALKKALLPLRQAGKSLDTLTICGTWPWTSISPSLGAIMPEQVKQLHIQGFEFQLGRFDTSGLRYICYTLDVDISDFFWLLDTCTSLQYLDIGVREDKFKHLCTRKVKEYNNIHVLRLRNTGNSLNIEALLNSLTMPYLTRLSVEDSKASVYILPSLANMLRRSFSGLGSPLRELEVNTGQGCGSTGLAFLESLGCVPHLKRLSMRSGELTDDILHAFTLNRIDDAGVEHKGLCPELEALHWSFGSRITLDAVTSMLCSRWSKQPASLFEVHLRYSMVKKVDLLKNPTIEYAVRKGAILEVV